MQIREDPKLYKYLSLVSCESKPDECIEAFSFMTNILGIPFVILVHALLILFLNHKGEL